MASTSISDAIIRDLEKRGVPGVVRQRHVSVSKATKSAAAKTESSTSKSLPKPTPPPTRPLSDEQKLALQRWNSLTEEQQHDLSTQYSQVVQKKKLAKENAQYRPDTAVNQVPSTDYNKWNKWAKEETTEEDEEAEAARGLDSSTAPLSTTTALGLLATTPGKVEAFFSCFLLAWVFTSIVLPLALNHTFTKQLCFGLLMGCCVLADQRGHLVAVCGGFQGAVVGMVLGNGVGMEWRLVGLGSISVGILGCNLRRRI